MRTESGLSLVSALRLESCAYGAARRATATSARKTSTAKKDRENSGAALAACVVLIRCHLRRRHCRQKKITNKLKRFPVAGGVHEQLQTCRELVSLGRRW